MTEQRDPWAPPPEARKAPAPPRAAPLPPQAITEITEAHDVTDEIIEIARAAASHHSPLLPTPWGKVWTSMDSRTLADGSLLSTGGRWGKDTPAKRRIKRILGPERKQAKEDAIARGEDLPTKAQKETAQREARVTSNWTGECAEHSCNRQILPGDPVVKSTGRGWMHYTCAMRRWRDE